MIIQQAVHVRATPSAVFDVLAEPEHWFRLDPTLVDVTPRTRLTLGATGIVRNRRGPGIIATVAWTTTELIPEVRVTQYLRGAGYQLTEDVSLEPADGGTTMSVVDTLVPTNIGGRLLVALSRRIMERDLETRFARLKLLVEAGS